MAQVLEFKLPDLGEGLTEAEIVRWLVEVGDVVDVDQPVVEVETAKAMVEVPCPYSGVVTARFGEEGTELPVGAPLLTVAVGATPETVAAELKGAGSGGQGAGGSGPVVPAAPAPEASAGTTAVGTASTGTGAAGTPGPGTAASDTSVPGGASGASSGAASGAGATRSGSGSGNVLVGYGTSEAPARRRRVRPGPLLGAQRAGVPPHGMRTPEQANGHSLTGAGAGVSGSGTSGGAGGRGSALGDAGEVADGPVPVISPLVRRLAREHGLDLRELTGSGPDGLILRADVEYALRAAATPPAARPAAEPVTGRRPHTAAPAGPSAAPADSGVPAEAAGTVRIPLKGIRGTAAEKLSRSRREIPDATCWVDADATELLRAREAMNAAGGPKISLIALLARITTAALARFPELNATVDTAAKEIVRFEEVHLGFAAQTDRGLVVPVVRDAHRRDAESLTAEFARLTEAARAGRLAPAELTGGTFTLNNYGVFGVDGSTPIINHPEAAMLGVGRITPKPWVHQGELAVRHVVQLALTFDHRVCDGGTAGGFLRYVADCVEQPAVLLRTL